MSDRKRRLEIAKSLKELLQSKGKVPSVKYQQTFEELKEASDLVSYAFPTDIEVFFHVHNVRLESLTIPVLFIDCKRRAYILSV